MEPDCRLPEEHCDSSPWEWGCPDTAPEAPSRSYALEPVKDLIKNVSNDFFIYLGTSSLGFLPALLFRHLLALLLGHLPAALLRHLLTGLPGNLFAGIPGLFPALLLRDLLTALGRVLQLTATIARLIRSGVLVLFTHSLMGYRANPFIGSAAFFFVLRAALLLVFCAALLSNKTNKFRPKS